ncbi:MAG: hypothetical protein BGO68_01685 [Candidatus Amoebophilus sp. 36-38]|nr:MAG: hypothetical protein BGO68_01685 [Candidatus Amoebophilus sp. 36-38]
MEVFYPELKQTCRVERYQARHGRLQRNHIYISIMAWFKKHTQRINKRITMDQQDWEVIKKNIVLEIKSIMLAT